VAEQYAEGTVDREALRTAWMAARAACGSSAAGSQNGRAAIAASFAAHRSRACARQTAGRVFSIAYYSPVPDPQAHRAAERAAQLVLVRCIFGNPFRPVSISPAWRTWNGGTIPNLARTIYDRRAMPLGSLDSTRLGILADALEEAGCTDGEMMSHLRGGGEHV